MVVISRLAEQPLISRLVSLKQQFRMQTGRLEPIYNNVREYINICSTVYVHRLVIDARWGSLKLVIHAQIVVHYHVRMECAVHVLVIIIDSIGFAPAISTNPLNGILLVLHNIKSHRMHDKNNSEYSEHGGTMIANSISYAINFNRLKQYAIDSQ